MKKIYILFIFIALAGNGYGQGLENFDNSNATASYADGSFVGEDAITWNYVKSRDENNDANSSGIDGNALMLRHTTESSRVYSGTISGGIGNFSVKLYKGFTGGGNRQVELFINDVSKGTSTVFDDYDEHIFTVSDINISGYVVIRIDNITDKQVIVDDITWTAFASSGPDNPTSFTATTAETDQIDLTFAANAAGNNVVIVYDADGSFTDPSGAPPVVGQAFSGGTLLYNGTTSPQNHIGLGASQTVYYKAWSYDNTDYSTGLTDDATTYASEPSNHPTDFAATTNSSSEIIVSWIDSDAASYLIKGSDVSYAAIVAPIDGVAESDGGLVMNVNASIQTHPFAGLASSTTYYFKIYPYNGADASINYKTDVTVLTANATTDEYTGPNAWINEFHYDNDGGDVGEFVEVVIEGTYTLSYFQVNLYNGSGGASYESETLNNFTAVTAGDFTFYTWQPSSMQNGYPEGLALSYDGTLIVGQFLSYEGTLTATDGPASGVTSTDIGVEETGTTPLGYSLQLKGGGDAYAMFYWVDPSPETPGALNNGQYLGSNYTTWTGAIDDDWTDAANWNNGAADATLSVIIPSGLTNYPTLTGSGNCIDIFMESNASLVGVDNLTVSGTATIERTVDGYTSDTDGYHFLSAPVSGFTITGSDFAPVSGTDDFFSWDEPTNYWLNFYEGMTDTEFEVGKGYLVAYDPTNPGTFYGSLNNSSETKNLTYTPTMGEGWNLLGNPYPSAIDWDLLTKSGTPDVDINGTVYVLRGSDNVYIDWNGSAGDLTDGYIPVNNGFFVKTNTSGQTITIDPADQVHSSVGFLKSGNKSSADNTLKISIANETYQNNSYIQFRSDATVEFDNAIDAYKLFGSSDAPQLFTSLSETEYSINCIPFSFDGMQLPMGFKNRVTSEYTISVSGLESFQDENIEIFLEDLETTDLIDLTVETYTFTAENIDYNDRFILHFSGITAVGEEMMFDDVQIYANDNSVYFKFDKMPNGKSTVTVYNTLGQRVYGGEFEMSTLSSIRLNNKAGIYIVHLQSENGSTTKKVMIK